MNYPVLTAGLVLAPRGIGTMVAIMIVGRIINRVDPRHLLASGQLLTAAVLWEMAYFTPDVSQWTLIRTGVPELLRAYRAREPWCEGRLIITRNFSRNSDPSKPHGLASITSHYITGGYKIGQSGVFDPPRTP